MAGLLAADIGGTKTIVQLSDCPERTTTASCEVLRQKRYDSAAYGSFDDILDDFLAESPANQDLAACFAVAGPVSANGEQARVTNLPWSLDAGEIRQRHGLARVRLINDFQAVGYGVTDLDESDLVWLQRGRPQRHGPRLVVGAGTGFGVTQLFWREQAYQPSACEAGHMDFAPANSLQDRLLTFLRQQLSGQISTEALLSGRGLKNIFDFISSHGSSMPTPDIITAINGDGVDPAAIISKHAINGTDHAAIDTFRLFVDIYGSITGNLALMTLPSGGVFIAGGVAAKNIDLMRQDDRFVKAFLNKSKMHDLLQDLPLAVISNQECGLIGARAAAAMTDI